MNCKPWFKLLRILLVICAACSSLLYLRAQASTADIASTPLGTRSGSNVSPNMMFILDDSGSMDRNYLPDGMTDDICKACPSGSCTTLSNSCQAGMPPFYAYQFNTIYYNPAVTYNPGVNYLNASLGNATPSAALNNPYNTASTSSSNVATAYRDIYWCTTSAPSAADLTNTAVCRRNGFDNGSNFHYQGTAGLPTATFRNQINRDTATPHYYNMTPREHCTDETLITCTLSTTPTTVAGTTYNVPAPVRWCRTAAAVNSATAVSGNNVSGSGARDCQALTDGTYQYPRLGNFTRVTIATGNTYPRAASRTDCGPPPPAAPATTCTYTEELQNFANWYSYYRTRLLTMKTVPGRVFASIGNDPNSGDLRVGFVTINAIDSSRYLLINDFKNNTHRQNWFNKFYGITAGSSTPLRQALSRVGRHFAGITSGINSFMPDEPMLASCQRNYALLTTDGYWNGSAGQNIAGSAVGDQDDTPNASAPIYVDRTTTGTLDGIGTVTVTVTPTTNLEQVVCVGSGNASFSGPSTTPCGCTGSNKRVKQRTRVTTTTVTQTDAANPTSPAPTIADTYQDITACTLPSIDTITTPITDTEQIKCVGSAAVTFTTNGSATTSSTCGCTGTNTRIKQRTIARTNTTVVNDGVVTSNTTTAGTTTFQDFTGCTVPLIVTTVTPISDREHVKCTVNNTVTFSDGSTTPCGCAAGQSAIKQRLKDRTQTVITTDGAVTSNTSANTNAFSNFVGCTNQLVTTATTPITDTEQVKCVGSGTATFSANGTATTSTTCGCSGVQTRIKQRIVARSNTIITTDGVVTSNTTTTGAPGNTTFQDISACTTPLISTTVTHTRIIEEQALTANASSSFLPVNGSNANENGICGTGQARIKRRQTDYDTTVITTDGVAGGPTVSGQTFTFSNPGSCVNLTTTVVQPLTETAARVFAEASPGTTNFPASATNSSISPNPQTSYTCTGGGTRTILITRTMNYNRTTTTVGAGAPVITFSNLTSAASFALGSCDTSGKSNSGPTVANNGSASTTTTGAPTPAATSTTNTPSTSTNGGTNLAITLSPNPRNGVNGTTTTSNNGGTNLAVTLTPNPTNNITGAATVSNNGGTNLAITLTPNPNNGVNGTAVTSNNGGTTVAITLTPNPTATIGAGTTTTTPGGNADTLADVAMYYYKTDLRPGTGTLGKDNVPTSGKFIAPHQHMITFTLGLGLDGQMTYRDDYETALAGDFFKIKSGANNCIWTTGTCNWPIPVGDTATAIDDLWHAAVNGRGKYFSAKVPGAVENGVKETLAAINIATGSAAAAATSTPNLTTTNNTLYSSTYRTEKWDGELVARKLDPATGLLTGVTAWTAASQLNGRGLAASDTRTIYTFDGLSVSKLKSFTYANLTPTEQAYFDNKCTPAIWNQCTVIAGDATRLAAANSGANLVNYLRGQRGNELDSGNTIGAFRTRENLLGDTVNAKPAFMGPPEQQYEDLVTPSYGTFKIANANRQNTLFSAANDGMLHAFNADTGAELWAYVPKMILPNLYRLANSSYGTAHAFTVDGSPIVADVYFGGAWKSVLVGGFNSGGRGYYALDVTDPANPKALWEICADAALCAITDTDMGLSYGPAVIGKRPADGKWVALVTSGYNNIGPGNGGGYLYMIDLATGAVLEKVGTTISGTNVGDSTTPSGFAKISGFVENSIVDNTVKRVYGGDLLGNMWRFDLNTSPPTVKRIAQLKDGSGTPRPQSITTAPEITRFDAGFNAIYIGTGRFLGESDLGNPATLVPAQPYAYQQSIYAFKDTDTPNDLGDLRLAGASLVKQTLTVVDAATRSISSNVVNWTTNNGWYVDLNPVCAAAPGCSGAAAGESPGERINIDLQLVRGTLVAIANEPNSELCSTGGDSILYQFDYASGSYVQGSLGGVVGVKIASALAVGGVLVQTTTGKIEAIITTAEGKLPERPISTSSALANPQRAAWRELLDTRKSLDPSETP